MRFAATLVIALAAVLTLGAAKPQPDWLPLDPTQTLVIDTSKGRIVMTLR